MHEYVCHTGTAIPAVRKVTPPKCSFLCRGMAAGSSENIRRTVTNSCEALSMVIRYVTFLCICCSMDRFAGGPFFIPTGRVFRNTNKEVRIMKKLVSLVLALTMLLTLSACGSSEPVATEAPKAEAPAATEAAAVLTGVEDGVLTVGMECAYAPYNWTQMDDSNGAVPIANNPGAYANGYDVMIAKKICEANGWELEVMAIGWDGLVPALNAGQLDAVIAGQSMTETRMQEVDMAGPYFYASIVCVTQNDNALASATGISQLSGACTAQTGTIWYDSCLPQIEGAELMPASETAPAMIMAVTSGTVDYICTDMPTAMGACATYDNLTILDFTGSEDNFEVDAGEINIGISVVKGNTTLLDAMNAVLGQMTVEDFNNLMNEAIGVQPEI